MGRAEAGTPKAISNAIKAKGLQKLKFYCQACEKQCRDANGFKCHMASENHQRQMLIIAENPGRFLSDYSKQFLKDFMHLFRTRFGSKRVFANQVYQEYIKDRYHVHMNSTKWLTLGSFVAWLGKNSLAEVDRTERGWYITYIDRDPETLKKQDNLKKKDKMEKDYDERMRMIIEEQVKRGQDTSRPIEEENEEDKLLKRDDENDKIVLKLGIKTEKKDNDYKLIKNEKNELIDEFDRNDESDKQDNKLELKKVKIELSNSESNSTESSTDIKIKQEHSPKRISIKRQKEIKRSALDDIMEEEENKRKTVRRDNWITTNLIVKIISKKIPEKYQNKKGVIEKVEDRYLAYVRLNDSNALIKLDQNDLETVIPKEGNLVKIVNGAYLGAIAKLIKVNQVKLNAQIRLEKGINMGKQLEVELEDICKFVE